MKTSLPLALLAGAALVTGCKHAEKPTPEAPSSMRNIDIGTVHADSVANALRIPGRVEADPARLVHIFAPLSGRLLTMTLVPGQEVHKGQVVATLQSGDVAQARADFEKAKIESLRADRALDRGKLLAAHEVLSQADLQELQAVDAAAHAEQARTRQRVHELGFSENGTGDTTAVTAPITGTVLDIGSAAGEMQRSLETTNGLATVANLDTVWVTGDVYENDLHAVHPHSAVTITFSAYPGEEFHGTVSDIGQSFDPNTHSVKVRVVLPNPQHRLKPAMFATLSVAGASQSRILLPITAVLHSGDSALVYMPAGPGQFTTRTVTTGSTVGDQIEITGGLHEGDRVVMHGAAFLRQPVGD